MLLTPRKQLRAQSIASVVLIWATEPDTLLERAAASAVVCTLLIGWCSWWFEDFRGWLRERL